MPRFYFRVLDDLDSADDEGAELRDGDAARGHATQAARELMCETLTREGRITLHHCIEIEDQNREQVGSVFFRDAIRIENEK